MGEANPARMHRKDVIRLRDSNADKAYFANYSLRVLRVLLEHSVDLGSRETNPAKGVSEIKTNRTERKPWPQELLDAYRASRESPSWSVRLYGPRDWRCIGNARVRHPRRCNCFEAKQNQQGALGANPS